MSKENFTVEAEKIYEILGKAVQTVNMLLPPETKDAVEEEEKVIYGAIPVLELHLSKITKRSAYLLEHLAEILDHFGDREYG